MFIYADVIYFILSLAVFLSLCILAGRCTRPQEVRQYLDLTRPLDTRDQDKR